MNKTVNTSNNPRADWLFGGNPNAIEAQEKQGQEEFVEALQLPRKVNSPRDITNAADQYAKMGIKVFTTSKGDDLFLGVKLSDGWKKEATDHSMWSHLVDGNGSIRAQIFYKAAFYDRDSFINFCTRYITKENYFESEKNPNDTWDCAREMTVVDNKTKEVLFKSEKYFFRQENVNRKKAEEWLTENYPDWKDVNAYWA